MSLLGFNAVGRLALGQLPALGLTNTVLLTAAGAYTAAGQDAAFHSASVANAGALTASAMAATFKATLSANPAGYLVAGNVAWFKPTFAAAAGGYAAGGQTISGLVRQTVSAGSFLLTGGQATVRTFLWSAGTAYAVHGYPSAFTRDLEAWFPRPFDTVGWTGAAVAAEPWTPKPDAASSWTAGASLANTWTPAAVEPEPWTTE